ncbi:hypothetical protein [Mycobacterium talmoniae]|uniref:Betaine-aldehyde dehydrogenase n=1 Tax=Mycobacterium talmoniae TaxID=1858794 RepID=A0A2S8BIT8_9MYCO|nr:MULTISPECIES: hypothetical protein [Mycobacterium]PQM46600.1 hypothetical protein C1Y40_03230 [Mycobacterium talmoniae]
MGLSTPDAQMVLAETPTEARILREEVFGPIAATTGFDGEGGAEEIEEYLETKYIALP